MSSLNENNDSSELCSILERRQEITDGKTVDELKRKKCNFASVFTEFHEFGRQQIRQYEAMFKRFANTDGRLDLPSLKLLMEAMGAPQTHLGLKAMIHQVNEDQEDGKNGQLSFRQLLLIYRKALNDDNEEMGQLAARLKEEVVDVERVGVLGAKEFFQAKIEDVSRGSKFEDEIRLEQTEKRLAEEERALRRRHFLQTASVFK